jgi:hypothetical protein
MYLYFNAQEVGVRGHLENVRNDKVKVVVSCFLSHCSTAWLAFLPSFVHAASNGPSLTTLRLLSRTFKKTEKSVEIGEEIIKRYYLFHKRCQQNPYQSSTE